METVDFLLNEEKRDVSIFYSSSDEKRYTLHLFESFENMRCNLIVYDFLLCLTEVTAAINESIYNLIEIDFIF